jgi:signal transduction histidine kinase
MFNSAAEKILQLKRDDVVAKPVVDLIGMFAIAGQRWLDVLEAWSEKPPAADSRPVLEEQLELEGERVISVRLSPVVLDNEFLGTVSIFRDITQEVEVDRLKSEFVATVSHELRTPMTSIKGYVDVLLMGAVGKLTDEQRSFLEIVRNNTERLGALVNDLLDISGIESRQVELTLEPLDPLELLTYARDHVLQRVEAESKTMRVEMDLPDDLSSIHGDRACVQQILRNLVDNSFDYSPAGGTITLTARGREHELEIEVADNGIGIPLADQGRVFDRFFRGEQALEMGVSGTGLGLSIALNLVEMHGGRIWLNSDGPGKGSTFTFALPVLVSAGGAQS